MSDTLFDGARNAATSEVAMRKARTVGGSTPQEIGEVPMLCEVLREATTRLDREIGRLREKLAPVMSPDALPSANEYKKFSAESQVGTHIADTIAHLDALSNVLVETTIRTKL